MPKTRAHVFVSGRVQGVFFRSETRDAARRCRVTGWVRNLPDGRVESVFEGDEKDVEKAVAWCYDGPAYARVTNVELTVEEYTGEYDTFSITY